MARNKLDLPDYLPYLVNRVGAALVARFTADALAQHGLTIAMWRVLAALSDNGAQRQVDLAGLTSIDVSTLSRLVSRLIAMGLVTRLRSAQQQSRGGGAADRAGRDAGRPSSSRSRARWRNARSPDCRRASSPPRRPRCGGFMRIWRVGRRSGSAAPVHNSLTPSPRPAGRGWGEGQVTTELSRKPHPARFARHPLPASRDEGKHAALRGTRRSRRSLHVDDLLIGLNRLRESPPQRAREGRRRWSSASRSARSQQGTARRSAPQRPASTARHP